MFASKIEGVNNTMQGEFPAVNVRISNPETGEDCDLLSDPVMAGMRGTLGWDTRDYTNTGAGDDNANGDTAVRPASTVCSSCHDDAVAQPHMTCNGGNFTTTQAALDACEVAEECSVCHKEGATAAVSDVHKLR